MKIVFFNRFFYPDTSATSQVLSDLAFHLAATGADVHVVTSRVPGGDSALETIRGVKVHRVTSAIVGPHGLARRALAYAGYYRGSRRAARELLESGDIAVVKTDPPMLSAAVGPVASGKGAKVVAWMQDIFPEVAREYGVPGMRGPLFDVVRRIRNRSLVAADRVIAIGERMAGHLGAEGVPLDKLMVIPNWSDGNSIRPMPREPNALRSAWDLSGKTVVGYSGNLGRVHEFDTMLEAARNLRHRDDIRFLIVGRGPRLPEVQSRVARDGLDNVVFQPHQERSSLSESLAVADVHLCVLDPRFDGLVLPSKLYGIMAAGRPIIFVGDPVGESARLVANAACGICIATGDSASLVGAIEKLAADREQRETMGLRGREAFERAFTIDQAHERWMTMLSGLSPARAKR